MKKYAVIAVLTCLFPGWLLAKSQDAQGQWAFSKVTKIKVSGVSGDIVIRPVDHKTGKVELRSDVHPEGSFRAEVEQKGNTLYISEKWRDSSSGAVEWIIYLPSQKQAPRIQISNASGDLDCDGVAARIRFETASGDVELNDVALGDDSDMNTASGDFKMENMTITEGASFSTASGDFILEDVTIQDGCRFSTASGDVRCMNCKCTGSVEFSTASGDVVVRDTELAGPSEFSSASGNVKMYLDELPREDIRASSASGNVLLDVENFGRDFTLVLIKRKDKGRLSCPFKYTDEDTFEDYHIYEKKIVERGSGVPEIKLKTASGKVTVRD